MANWRRPPEWLGWVLAMAPLVWLVAALLLDRLGANPVEKLLHESGRWSLHLLLVTLLFSPMRRLGWPLPPGWRRIAGLSSFCYLLLHALTWLLFDHWFSLSEVWIDISERPHIAFGVAGLLLLIPLAVTSTRGMVRRLGRNWQRIHWLIYPATAIAMLHFALRTKGEDHSETVIYLEIGLLLFGERLLRRLQRSPAGRRKGPAQ